MAEPPSSAPFSADSARELEFGDFPLHIGDPAGGAPSPLPLLSSSASPPRSSDKTPPRNSKTPRLWLSGNRSGSETPTSDAVLFKAFMAHKLFQGLPDNVLDELMAHLRPTELERDQILFQAGDCGSDMFVVHSGKLNCINKDKLVVKVLAPGAPWHLLSHAVRRSCGSSCPLRGEQVQSLASLRRSD